MAELKNQKIIVNNLEKLLARLEEDKNANKKDILKLKFYITICKMGMVLSPVGILLSLNSTSFTVANSLTIAFGTLVLAETLFVSSYLGSKNLINHKMSKYEKTEKEITDVQNTLENEKKLLITLSKENKQTKSVEKKEDAEYALPYEYYDNYDLDNDLGYSRRRKLK